MLCKRTMRAALAPMIGILATLVATTVSAEVKLNPAPGPEAVANAAEVQNYAAESLTNAGCLSIGGTCHGYRLMASDGELEITAKTDTLIPAGQYYVRYDLVNALLRVNVADEHFDVTDNTDADIGTAWGQPAFKSMANDAVAIIQTSAGFTAPVGSTFTIDFSGAADDATTDTVNELYSALFVRGAGRVTVELGVYESIQDAKAKTGAIFNAGPATVANLARSTSVKVTPMLDIANVSTPDEMGGPFRRFVPTANLAGDGGMGGTDSGVLAEVEIGFNPRGFKDVNTNAPATAAATLGDTAVSVTAAAGSFAVATKNGGLIRNSGPGAVNNVNPWMVADEVACMSGPLTLGVVGAEIDTYDEDPDGSTGDDAGPLRKGDVTPAGIASANQARGTTKTPTGKKYFCVLVDGNEDPIPEVGDPQMKNAYMITVTPTLATAADPIKPPASGPHPAGAIDRNGTTVHLTYLSTHEAYNQRLVLVNRGGDAAKFWIEDESFNLEAGTMLMKNDLGPDSDLSIPANGRLVMRVQDDVTFDGMTRGAATVNVAAPTRDIDVMTIQVHPGTGQIDTTVYQNE